MAAEADQWMMELDEFVSQFVHHFVLVRALNRAALCCPFGMRTSDSLSSLYVGELWVVLKILKHVRSKGKPSQSMACSVSLNAKFRRDCAFLPYSPPCASLTMLTLDTWNVAWPTGIKVIYLGQKKTTKNDKK